MQDLPAFQSSYHSVATHLTQNLQPQLTFRSFCFSNPHAQMGSGCDRRARGRREKKSSSKKSPLPCSYTHQTSLIRQQQNFINRMDIIE